MTTTTAVRPLNASEVGYLRDDLTRRLAHARDREDGTKGSDEWVYWSARCDALDDALLVIDTLCASEPWCEGS